MENAWVGENAEGANVSERERERDLAKMKRKCNPWLGNAIIQDHPFERFDELREPDNFVGCTWLISLHFVMIGDMYRGGMSTDDNSV